MNLSTIVSLVSALIALTSAYIAWRNTRPLPNLEATVTVVLPLGQPGHRALLMHFAVTNRSTHPVQLLGYRLQLTTTQGQVVPVPAIAVMDRRVTFTLDIVTNFAVTMTDEDFADWPPRAVGYGQIEMGWLLFDLDESLVADPIAYYELTFTDALGKAWKAGLSPEDSDRWFQGQKWRSPNIVQLVRSAGAKVEIVAPRSVVVTDDGATHNQD